MIITLIYYQAYRRATPSGLPREVSHGCESAGTAERGLAWSCAVSQGVSSGGQVPKSHLGIFGDAHHHQIQQRAKRKKREVSKVLAIRTMRALLTRRVPIRSPLSRQVADSAPLAFAVRCTPQSSQVSQYEDIKRAAECDAYCLWARPLSSR